MALQADHNFEWLDKQLIQISLLNSLEKISGPQIVKESKTTWGDFCRRIATPRIGTKDGPAYVFATFKEQRRLKANCEQVFALVFDFDNANEERVELSQLEPELEGYFYIAHATHSNTAEEPKWRLILPLKHPIAPHAYSTAWQYAHSQLGKPYGIDKTAAQPERAFYFPSVPSGTAEQPGQYWHKVGYGEFFEVDWGGTTKILSIPDELTPVWKDREQAIKKGGRNDGLFRLACSYRQAGLEEPQCLLLLQRENTERCRPPASEDEIGKIVKGVYQRYEGGLLPHVYGAKPQDGHKGEDEQALVDMFLARIGAENIISQHEHVHIWDHHTGIWDSYEDRGIKQILGSLCLGRKKASKINSALDLLKGVTYRRGFQFNIKQDVIPVINGELHLEGGAWCLKPHSRESYFTYQLPVEFDAGAECWRFHQFLDEIFPPVGNDSTTQANILLEAFGYSLLPSTSLERAFWLVGGGANGKSVCLNILTELLGRANYSSVPMRQLEQPFHRAHLLNKLANIMYELKAGEDVPDGVLKAIVSGEPTHAENKFQPPFTFRPFCTLWMATNELPPIRDHSSGFFRRVTVLSFNKTFEKGDRDIHLTEKLKEELPGILNLVLAALAKLLERREFSSSAQVEADKEDWEKSNDTAWMFAEECAVHDRSLFVHSSDLYQRYKNWAADNGFRQLSHKRFIQRLKSIYRDLSVEHTERGRVLVGLGLKSLFS